MQPLKYNLIPSIILLIPIIWFGCSIYEKTSNEIFTGENAYHAANRYFSDGLYENALQAYNQAISENSQFIQAKRGIARSLMQLGRNVEALDFFNEVIELEPTFATSFANRGILHDRMKSYPDAIKDYQKALQLDANIAKGPSFITRFLKNQVEKPATLLDRLHYLQAELAKPEKLQVLHIQEKDDAQISYNR